MKQTIRLVQEALKARGLYSGAIDGIAGPMTDAALSELPELPAEWPRTRKIIGCVQILCGEQGIDVGPVDGYLGPRTRYGLECLVALKETGSLPSPWRDQPIPSPANPNGWPTQSEDDLTGYFGPVAEQLVRVQLPYPHRLAWDKRKVVDSFVCHPKVEASLQRVLQQVFDTYGMTEIRALGLDLWGGCFAKRQKRGGSTWSTHAWGIAIDYDPERNQLNWGRHQAQLARPEYEPWWACWENEGWVSLGRSRNFDWMHVQAARLP
ncbi:MAG: M15 family peptidase [Pseudomonadota bacterium]|nr:M15 family peptidase [Pseudomonadota bacterium]